MHDIKQLTDDISVCAFVPPGKLAALAPKFRTIINNRPEGEEPGQPSSAEIEAEAHRLGLDYVHVPVIPGQIGDEQVAAFGQAVSDRKGPVLAFCKSGRRAASLWALSEVGKRDIDDILKTAADAGHDLSDLRTRLEERASAP